MERHSRNTLIIIIVINGSAYAFQRLGNTADMKRPQADGKLSLHKVDEFLARCERKVISSALG